MPGKVCPNCGQRTFFETPTGRKCSKCGMIMQESPGRLGRGKKCSSCGRYTVGADNRCTNCGAKYFPPKGNSGNNGSN